MTITTISNPPLRFDSQYEVENLEGENFESNKPVFYNGKGNIIENDDIDNVIEKSFLGDILGKKVNNSEKIALGNLIRGLSEVSLVDVGLCNKDKWNYLLGDAETTLISFARGSDHAIEISYSANYKDKNKINDLFTLNYKIILDNEFKLNKNEADISFTFHEKCPIDLIHDLKSLTFIERIWLWIKSLFSSGSYTANNTVLLKINDMSKIRQRSLAESTGSDLPSQDEFAWDYGWDYSCKTGNALCYENTLNYNDELYYESILNYKIISNDENASNDKNILDGESTLDDESISSYEVDYIPITSSDESSS
ncbi:hypothetical protein, partial [Yersinia aleksiciae]|uniref:hypothetical protein n=1 Tax=Yersinia aleksiciae TaxID=263819 RepID=UPI00119E9B59